MSRRSLLMLAGSGMTAAALGACGVSAGKSGTQPIISRPPDWEKLRARLSGSLVLPGDAGYDGVRVGYNPLYDNQHPSAVAECATPADVQACLEVARCSSLRIAARSGGHSYGGYSTPDQGLVVDLGRMASIHVDPAGIAVIGAGAQLIDVYAALASAGRCLPSGTCASVGISGITLGGGLGVLTRLHGLTCDALVSADVVLADGSLRTVSEEHHPDLFWALRGGGGGNFGIVTSFAFRTPPAPSVVVFSIEFPVGSAGEVLGAWQEWQPRMPNELFSNCVVFGGPSAACSVNGCFVGTAATLDPLLDDLVQKSGLTPRARSTLPKGYLDAMKYLAGCGARTIEQCHLRGDGGELDRASFVASSRVMAGPLPDPGKVATLLREHPGINLLFDSLGGRVAERRPDETAFVHRTARAIVQVYTDATEATRESRKQAVSAVQKALSDIVGRGAYVNYIDPEMSDWAEACYGSNLARLRQVARTHDPDRVFAFAQNVGG